MYAKERLKGQVIQGVMVTEVKASLRRVLAKEAVNSKRLMIAVHVLFD